LDAFIWDFHICLPWSSVLGVSCSLEKKRAFQNSSPDLITASRVVGFFVMVTPNSVDAAERCTLLSSSDPELPAGGDVLGLADPDEITPLLRTKHARVFHRNPLEWWSSARSVTTLSVYIDKNAGLLLVASSQFFLSAMNVSVKWLNSLDEPIPMLEVCLRYGVSSSELTSSKIILSS